VAVIKNGISKKAYFFSFIAIIIVTIFVVTFSNLFTTVHVSEIDATDVQAELLNNFVKEIKESYVPTILFTSAKASILTMLKDKSSIESVGNVREEINEMMFLGTFNGAEAPLLDNNTLDYWKDKLITSSEKLHIITDIVFGEAEIKQKDAWTLEIIVPINLTAQRSSNMFFDIQFNGTAEIPITQFIDPLFLRNLDERKRINKSAILSFDSIDDVQQFFDEGSYIMQSTGSSFLQRLEGRTVSGGAKGIQSFINNPALLGNREVAYVDNLYFAERGCVDNQIYHVDPPFTPAGFYLDLEHILKYNITEYSIYACGVPEGG